MSVVSVAACSASSVAAASVDCFSDLCSRDDRDDEVPEAGAAGCLGGPKIVSRKVRLCSESYVRLS